MLDYIAIIYSGPLREYSEVTKASPRLHGSQNEMRVLQFRVEGLGDYIVKLLQKESTRKIVAGGKNYFWLTAAARAAPRALYEVGLAAFFFLLSILVRGIGPGAPGVFR
jgi:hypothetical protein